MSDIGSHMLVSCNSPFPLPHLYTLTVPYCRLWWNDIRCIKTYVHMDNLSFDVEMNAELLTSVYKFLIPSCLQAIPMGIWL